MKLGILIFLSIAFVGCTNQTFKESSEQDKDFQSQPNSLDGATQLQTQQRHISQKQLMDKVMQELDLWDHERIVYKMRLKIDNTRSTLHNKNIVISSEIDLHTLLNYLFDAGHFVRLDLLMLYTLPKYYILENGKLTQLTSQQKHDLLQLMQDFKNRSELLKRVTEYDTSIDKGSKHIRIKRVLIRNTNKTINMRTRLIINKKVNEKDDNNILKPLPTEL